MKNFKHFYEGTYAKYILPGVLLQSVLIGGGYATGREIYSYGAKFGAFGWISGLTIGIGFALFAFLTFEICRIYKVYDYKNYIKKVTEELFLILIIRWFPMGRLRMTGQKSCFQGFTDWE